MIYLTTIIKHIVLSFLLAAFLITPVIAAEIDDSTIFVEAFNAYQQKDYLLAVEKCDQLNQVFPDSPLRDVTLLLIARASIKSGDNERAAKTVTMFTSEFPDSSLKTSVEDDLKTLSAKHQKGEVLQPDRTLQTTARRVRNERVAREKAAELKLEQERIAKVKSEQERIARIKLEEERLERERLLAEKQAKASIKVAINLREGKDSIAVGTNSSYPIEILNSGKSSEEFAVSVSMPKEYDAVIADTAKNENISTIKLAAGETFKGAVNFRMPAEMVDGHRSGMSVKVISAKYSDISFKKDAVIVSSAPLVRAVAKLAKQKVAPGEKLRYRVTVLNVGSLTAQSMTVRLQLPPQIDFQAAPDFQFKQEENGTLLFKVDEVGVGKLVEIGLDVKVRENSQHGQELRGQVEIVNGSLQRKDIFTASASTVQAK